MVMMDSCGTGEKSAPKLPASQYQALLEVAESIATHRDLPALFHDLKERLPRLVNFDTLWLVLHEPARNVMRVHILETPSRAYVDYVERTIEDAPSGMGLGTAGSPGGSRHGTGRALSPGHRLAVRTTT